MTDKLQRESMDVKWARLDEKMDFVLQEIKYLKDGTINRIEILEKTKADRKEIDMIQKKLDDNIDIRVRSLETDRVTQREHSVLVGQIEKVSSSQAKMWGYVLGISAVVSLVINIISIIIKK